MLQPYFLLVACTLANTPLALPTATPGASATLVAIATLPDTWTPAPSATKQPSATAIPTDKPTPVPSATPTQAKLPQEKGSLPIHAPHRLCEPVAETLPEGFLGEGVIFAGDFSGNKTWNVPLSRLAGDRLEPIDASLPGMEGIGVSPDRKLLAIAALNDAIDGFDRLALYLVDRSGQAKQWIDLAGYTPETAYGFMKWSPDGRYLAFAADRKPILVLDTHSK